jgi:hypothetical protein
VSVFDYPGIDVELDLFRALIDHMVMKVFDGRPIP